MTGPSWLTKARWCAVAVLLVETFGCGGSPPASGPTTPSPADPGKPGIVMTWGFTGVLALYSGAGSPSYSSYDTLQMIGNFVKRLGEGRATPGSFRILYTYRHAPGSIADPANREWYGPFLDTIAPIGTIDFTLPSRVQLSSYTLVIYDSCEILGLQSERDIVHDYVSRGGRALVLGDNFCWDGTTKSGQWANLLLADFGIAFTKGDPDKLAPLVIPPAQQTGLFEGVRQVSVFRVAPQTISGSVTAVLKDGSNIVSAMATINP